MSAAQRTGFDDLAGLLDYLDDNRTQIGGLVQEIGEVQKEFETRLVASQQRYENLKTALTAACEASGWQRPGWFAESLAAKLPKVREQQQARLSTLRADLQDLIKQRDEIEAEENTATEAMKQQNPRLNQREEELKQKQEELKSKLAEVEGELQRAAAGLGWLTRLGAILRLRKQYTGVGLALHDTNSRLTEVRNSWVDLRQKDEEAENRRREAWRVRLAGIARVKAQTAGLESDFDRACHGVAADEILTLLEEARGGEDPGFDRQLADLITVHRQFRDYENGIVQVAQLLGAMNGVAEGLKRFGESVAGVKKEQDMHSELTDLKLRAPEGVLGYHALWAQLLPLVRDEHAAGSQPAEFAAKARAAVGERLGEVEIGKMFTDLGDELKRATDEQW